MEASRPRQEARVEHITKAVARSQASVPTTSPPQSASTYVGYGKRDCPKCQGNGYLRKPNLPLEHPDFGEAWQCSCWKADAAPKLQENSGLTGSRLKTRLADIVVQGRPGTARRVKACLEFCERPTNILTVWGGVGNGKTMALQGVVNEMNSRGVAAIYMSAFAVKSHLQEAFDAGGDGNGQSAHRRLSIVESIPVLALDELDKVNPTTWTVEHLAHLLDARYQHAEDETAGTLIAMNEEPAHQPESIASRLLDGRNRVVHNDDPDIRPALAR
jgi:DNA replication protein DnaC